MCSSLFLEKLFYNIYCLGLFKNCSTSEFNALPFMFMLDGRHDGSRKGELFREFKLLKCLDDGNYKLSKKKMEKNIVNERREALFFIGTFMQEWKFISSLRYSTFLLISCFFLKNVDIMIN